MARRLIVGMTGASGAIYGVRLVQALAETGVETHLVVSKWAQQTLEHETGMTVAELKRYAHTCHGPGDMGAAVSSGSFATDGMVIAPCSTRTVAAIATGFGEHLVHRAADVILKERRKLVLVVRESPLNDIHLENMLKLSRMGVVILPPMPAFYTHPKTIDDLVAHTVARVLDQFQIPADFAQRWDGAMSNRTPKVREIK
jgi:4-hydroxy-3-polyprenylbenzoate decarboxylase